METIDIWLLLSLWIAISMGMMDQCLDRYKICSVKDRFKLQNICWKNGGLLKRALTYAGEEIISDCCQLGGCTKQYLCDFCENTCCQIAIDMIVMN